MSSPHVSASVIDRLSKFRPKTYYWALSFPDLALGLSVVRDLTIWRDSVQCSRDMFESSMSCIPSTRSYSSCDAYEMRCPDTQIRSEFLNLQNLYLYLQRDSDRLAAKYPHFERDTELYNRRKSLEETEMRMVALINITEAMHEVDQLSSETFKDLVELLTHAKPFPSEIIHQPERILQKLFSKHNFTIQVSGIPLPCNRVIAASISNVVARALKEKPTRKRLSISKCLSQDTVLVLAKMLEGKEISVNQRKIDDILQIDELLELTTILPLLDQLAEESRAHRRNYEELMKIVHLQNEIDSLNDENFAIVLHLINTEFRNDSHFCCVIAGIAKCIRPKSEALYQNLIVTLENQYNLHTQLLTNTCSSSEFLDIVKTDDVDHFRSEWQSFQVINNAVPVLKCLSQWLQSLHIPSNLDSLPLASVVAFYGAEKCLRFLIANHPKLVVHHKPPHSPLCFAIAGGNIPIVKLLFDHSDSKPQVLIAFAVHYHQEAIFDWLMQKSDVKVTDEWLLIASVSTQWFYSLSYCINNGITMNPLQAMRLALNSGATILFWVLILFTSDRSFDYNEIMPLVVSTENVDFIKQVLDMIEKKSLSRDTRLNCLIQAIDSRSLKLITAIWERFDVDELITSNMASSIVTHIKATRNREIIQNFLKYGNIFCKGSDVFDWLDTLTRKGDIEVIDMITNGAETYFTHFPRNPLPFATDTKTAQYLLQHGADPNYRGPDGRTRMDSAVKNNDLEMIELLKKYGAIIPQTADKH